MNWNIVHLIFEAIPSMVASVGTILLIAFWKKIVAFFKVLFSTLNKIETIAGTQKEMQITQTKMATDFEAHRSQFTEHVRQDAEVASEVHDLTTSVKELTNKLHTDDNTAKN